MSVQGGEQEMVDEPVRGMRDIVDESICLLCTRNETAGEKTSGPADVDACRTPSKPKESQHS